MGFGSAKASTSGTGHDHPIPRRSFSRGRNRAMLDGVFESLTSPRLRLRRFRESDLPVFCRYRADPEVARYQSWSQFTEEDGYRFFQGQRNLDPDTHGTWFQKAVTDKTTDEMFGDCGLHTLGQDRRQMEIGFTLAPQFQGKGYAT